MTQEPTFAAKIDEDFDKNGKPNLDSENGLIISCLAEYEKAYESTEEQFDRIDICRSFIKEHLIKIAKTLGGQKLYPIIRKMSEAHVHPDGSAVAAGQVRGDRLIVIENTVRALLKKAKINKQWRRESKNVASDGTLILRVLPNDKGLPQPSFLDRKKILFSSGAEDIHHEDPLRRANWSFEYEVSSREDMIVKYGTGENEKSFREVSLGSPIGNDDDLTDYGSQKSQEQVDDIQQGGEIGILYVRCLSSPVSGTYKFYSGETVEIEKGEPFLVKIAGGNKKLLEAEVGDNYDSFWQEIKNRDGGVESPKMPYIPYIDFNQTNVREGLVSPSIVSLIYPYLLRIIFYNALEDKNTELLANPIFHGIFSGRKAQDGENFFKYQLQKANEGKKITNIYTTRGQEDLKVDWDKLTPENINLDVTAGKRKDLEKEMLDIIGVLIDDTEFKSGEGLGVRQLREIAQRGAISYFQKVNDEQYKLLNKMVLSQFIDFFPDNSEEEVNFDTGINGFEMTKTLSELKDSLQASDIEVDWKFPNTPPEGGMTAAAELDSRDMLVEARNAFPNNTEVNRALLSITAKIVNSVAGTDAFNAEKAIQEEENRSKAQEEREVEAENAEIQGAKITNAQGAKEIQGEQPVEGAQV